MILFHLVAALGRGEDGRVMAKVLGESGRYVSQEAVKQRRRIVVRLLVIVGLLGVVEGLVISSLIPVGLWPAWIRPAMLIGALVGLWVLYKWGDGGLDALEKKRVAMMRGASGETTVALALENFPDDYRVIHDLTTESGNLDHVVVGPAGVFLLDAKNWRGVVSADGKGELLHNGQPTDRPLVHQFVGRVMGIKDKVKTLAPGLDPYFHSVFVFTSARVEANWGTTGTVHCIRDDQLHGYIVEKDFGRKLKAHEVDRIAQAFLGLAHMDTDFGASRQPGPKSDGK